MRFQDSFLRLVFVFTAVFTAEIPQVGATEALPVEIMPIGDSITRGSWTPYSVRNDVPGGYRKTLFQQLVATGATVDFVGDKSDNAAAAIDPHHNGNDGWRTDQMLAALPTWLAADPDVVLLSSEPFPFGEKHLQEIGLLLPGVPVRLVDGEAFSWYGSRLLHAPAYFSGVLRGWAV